MNRYNRIKDKLGVLSPHYLEIINQSDLHKNHVTRYKNDLDVETLETHFHIKISSELLSNKTIIKKHALINKILKEEFESGLHALSIEVI